MRIVSWNCNGKFRDKFFKIQELDADIYVIQECENPIATDHDLYRDFAQNAFWTGERKHQGLGIFASDKIHMEKNLWESYCLRCFLSVRINDSFDLIGVWACKPYIEEYYLYQCIHRDKITASSVIIGDFNSNAIWDKSHSARGHGQVVRELEEKSLVSAYHHVMKERQGEETQPTFYLHRDRNKPYHIDHCYAQSERVQAYRVADQAEIWLSYSDHLPIILDI